MKPILLSLVLAVVAPSTASAQAGNVGAWETNVPPDRAEPPWRLVSGKATEAISDGHWVVTRPRNFCRKVEFGPISPTRGQENFVEFSWSTDCRNNARADGFTIHAQGRRFRLHPIHVPDGRDLLLTGVRAGIGPDVKAAHIELSPLERFDATALNRYRIRWVTAVDDQFGFELTVNGKRIGVLPGELIPNSTTSAMAFEFRDGSHTLAAIRWQLNRGGTPVKPRAVRLALEQLARGHRQLFLDDVMVHHAKRLVRVVHQPTKYEKNPVIRHHQKPWQTFRAQLYGTVLYLPKEKRFRMWYLAGPRFPSEDPIRINGRLCCPNFQLLGYAESSDGFAWKLPELGLVDFNGSRRNNLCRISRENAEGVAVVHDPGDPDPARRFKAFYWEHSNCGPRKFDPVTPVNGMSVSFSADGKSWTNHAGNPVIGLGSDTGHQALWDPVLKKYVVFGRFGAGGRKIARAESDDFVRWSPPRLVFQTDATDGPGVQFYGMGITRYEGVYVGLPWMFRQGTTNRIDVQLATSRDGIAWTRSGNRQTFIPNGPKGSWDGGCIFTSAQPIQRVGDRIYIFYSALMLDHEEPRPSRKQKPEYGESSIGVATLRRDGFVSLSAGKTPGVLVTRAFAWPRGRRLHINADATGGEVTVAVLDGQSRPIAGLETSPPIRGDQLDRTVTWPGKPDPGRTVRLRFSLRNAKLYSWWLAGQ